MAIPVNIEDLINQRVVESTRIEFKSDFNPNAIIHSICAFANDIDNLGGGYIIVGVEEKDERHVRDDGLREVPVACRRAEDEGRPQARTLVVKQRAEAVGQAQRQDAEHRREKARGEIRHAEGRECRQQFPVEERRLVIPIMTVDAWRKVIPARQHFPCRLRVVALHRIRHGQQIIA